MFPVPSHLPRRDVSASLPNGNGGQAGGENQDSVEPEKDRILDLFEPLLGSTKDLSVGNVSSVEQKFEDAIRDNKRVSHQLLISNYPSISSHIRSGHEIRHDLKNVENRLSQLECEIDPTNRETSFIPPVLNLLQRHFTAAQNRSRAQRHVAALKILADRVEKIDRLEEAVYAGRGADDWVVDLLLAKTHALANGSIAGDEMLKNTKVARDINTRMNLLRSMVLEQVTDGFVKAITLKSSTKHDDINLVVQNKTSLQIPRIPRPGTPDRSTTSIPPPYSLSQIYAVLSRLDGLSQRLENLRARILRELLHEIIIGRQRVIEARSDTSSSLKLEHSNTRSPKDILGDTSTTLAFISEHVFPDSVPPQAERAAFLSSLQSSTSQLILDSLLKPTIPSSLASLAPWLETLHLAVDFESSFGDTVHIIKPFFESEAGAEWAKQRRNRVVEEVRRLILSGWGGWEAIEEQRDREITAWEEVEVEDEMVVDAALGESTALSESKDNAVEEDSFGWGFDESPKTSTATQIPQPATTENTPMDVDVDEGWGFDESAAGPSKAATSDSTSPSRLNAESSGEADDGWAFEDDLTPAPVVTVTKPKPAREAKKLGKRLAKAKEEDAADSGTESVASGMGINGSNSYRRPSQSVSQPDPVTQDDGWGWEEETKPKPQVESAVIAAPPAVKPKRKELKEIKKVIKETYLVSRACEKLMEIAERVLREIKELESSLPSPSFASSPPILLQTIQTIFDIYRSLLPAHFHTQLDSVPTLSMQVYNDSLLLSTRLQQLSLTYIFDAEDSVRRLREFGESIFERQIEIQRDGIVTRLNEVNFEGMGIEPKFKSSERRVQEIRGDLETLSRVLKTVLPMTIYLTIMGYLVDITISYISQEIIAQRDITEAESNRLNELLQTLHPLEELFVLQPDQPSNVVAHVPHWLKFCYVSELLTANLVDITYLCDNGALVDFTKDELIGMIKALFADSEKREKAIEKIEGTGAVEP